MPFAYYGRLSSARKRIYRRSDEIHKIPLPPGSPLDAVIARIIDGLQGEDRGQAEAGCQALLDDLTGRFRVPVVRVRVYTVRPKDSGGELHGLYEPFETAPARISVWMRTAERKKIVAFRSFFRTLIHELCHHLDYEFYKLPETFHTEGFYKRESSLVLQLIGPAKEPTKQSQGKGEN